MVAGVLSLQGAFEEHVNKLKECGISAVEVRFPEQLEKIDGLIIPGGESTTINKLLEKYKFKDNLDKFNRKHKPIFGTCAGLILLAKNIEGEDKGLGYIDIEVRRNAYGRQADSFEEPLDLSLDRGENGGKFESVFIRAPKIISAGKGVAILARYNEDMVLARENNVMVCAFHPELTDDLRIHKYFINMMKNYKGEN
ncbi:MAG: pyridoxal 5'-phosphate synthase glutaminase subunit PdxT [Actinomycetota bacterium]|nr:pyridoxal 5'-phosphate synthase glutaminase subunit PdxT [Actinomycetota bacterium]